MVEELGQLGSPAPTKGSSIAVDNGYGRNVLQLRIPTEKDKGNNGCREIPGVHFFCCSGGLKPLKLARLPRKRFYKAHCPFHKSYPHPLLPPPPISAFLFPSKLLGQIQFGKKQVASAAATATAAAERVLACSHR